MSEIHFLTKSSLNNPMELIQARIFSSKVDLKNLAATVLESRQDWRPRRGDEQGPFFYTLGYASYMDFIRNPSGFGALLARENSNLLIRFPQLYDNLLIYLKEQFGEDFRYTSEAPVPGFHIFHRTLPEGGKAHLDLQFQSVNWSNPEDYDFLKRGSFTIPVALPFSGAGLRFLPPKSVEHPNPEIRSLSYEMGKFYFFRGDFWHQIAPVEIKPGEFRITLQGHTIWSRRGFWVVYW